MCLAVVVGGAHGLEEGSGFCYGARTSGQGAPRVADSSAAGAGHGASDVRVFIKVRVLHLSKSFLALQSAVDPSRPRAELRTATVEDVFCCCDSFAASRRRPRAAVAHLRLEADWTCWSGRRQDRGPAELPGGLAQ